MRLLPSLDPAVYVAGATWGLAIVGVVLVLAALFMPPPRRK